MTLITHIWTQNINLIASDRRISDRNKQNPILSENIRKTYSKENSFVSFHGNYMITEGMSLNDLLANDYEPNDFGGSVEIANHLHNKLKQHQNRELQTGFIIGGFFNSTESVYYKQNQITYDHSKFNIGLRMNSESDEHQKKLLKLLDLSFNQVTGFNRYDFEQYDNYSNDQWLEIITVFYKKIHADAEANPVNGIGENFDIGIIRNGIFSWILNNDKCA